MTTRGITYGLPAALLGAGAALLLYYLDMGTIDPWYTLLLVGGTAGASFGVGYVLGHLTGNGIGPSSGDGE